MFYCMLYFTCDRSLTPGHWPAVGQAHTLAVLAAGRKWRTAARVMSGSLAEVALY